MEKENTLQKKTMHGMIWSFLDTAGTKIIQLVVHLILARLLTPSDFGLVGIVTIFIALSSVFVDGGLTNGLIREKDSTQEEYSTIFYFNFVVSLIAYASLLASSGAIARFFEEPELVSMIKVIGVVLIINAFGLIQRTMLTKKIDFSTQMKINIVSSVLAGIIAIFCAVKGLGVWSLVVRTLATQMIQVLLLSVSTRWLPSFVFQMEAFKRLFHFGWKVLLSNLLTQLYGNLYAFIIGKSFSASLLGFYTNAEKLTDAAAYSLSLSIEKVSFPILSSIQDDTERLKRGYRKIVKNSAYISFPTLLGLAAVAPTLFEAVLGESWLPSVSYFQVLCLSGLTVGLQSINVSVLQVKGRSDLFLKVSVIQKVFGLLVVSLVLMLGFGMTGLMWGLVVNSVLSYFVCTAYSKRYLGYSLFEQLKDIQLSFLMALGMAALVVSLPYILFLPALPLLVIQIIVGLSAYLACSALCHVEELQTIFDILQPIQKRLLKIGNR